MARPAKPHLACHAMPNRAQPNPAKPCRACPTEPHLASPHHTRPCLGCPAALTARWPALPSPRSRPLFSRAACPSCQRAFRGLQGCAGPNRCAPARPASRRSCGSGRRSRRCSKICSAPHALPVYHETTYRKNLSSRTNPRCPQVTQHIFNVRLMRRQQPKQRLQVNRVCIHSTIVPRLPLKLNTSVSIERHARSVVAASFAPTRDR